MLENVVQQIEVALKNASQAEALAKSEEQLKKNLIEISKKNRFETIISSVSKTVLPLLTFLIGSSKRSRIYT